MKKESKSTRGYARCDVNARSVFAFREIGKGYQAIRDFAMHMNIPPYNAKAYNSINDRIRDAYEEAAESSMKKASDEVRALLYYADDQTADIEVSLDGTWQKKRLRLIEWWVFLGFFFMHFFSGMKHPREDNPNLYYWAEMTGLHTQTFNI